MYNREFKCSMRIKLCYGLLMRQKLFWKTKVGHSMPGGIKLGPITSC